jgi:hypothetical protein
MQKNKTSMYRTDIVDPEIVNQARKRIKKKKGFFAHFITYISVIGFLFMINMMTSPGFWWWLFPAGGWGIGVVSHYFAVFGMMGIGNQDWEERELDREIRRMEEEGDVPLLSGRKPLPDELELETRKRVRKTWDEKDFV